MNLPEHGVIISYDPVSHGVRWDFLGSMPHPILVDACELIKTQAIHQQLAAMMEAARKNAEQRIVLPNGPVPPFRT